jgi:hypothetical protein
MAEEEKTVKKDNIIRSGKAELTPEKIDQLIKSVQKPSGDQSYFETLADRISSSIKVQTDILERAIKEVSKQVSLNRLQTLMPDKLVTKQGTVKGLSETGKTTSYLGKDKWNEVALLKGMKAREEASSFGKDKPMMVVIQDITPEAAEKIRGQAAQVNVEAQKEEEEKSNPVWAKLLALGLGALALIGAVERLFKMTFTDGPFEGVGKMLLTFVTDGLVGLIGKMGKLIPAFVKQIKLDKFFVELGTMFKRTIIKFFGKTGAKMIKGVGASLSKLAKGIFGKTFLKRLPLIGGIFSIGLGVKRLTDGDTIGGITDLVSGIIGLTPFGYPLALALDLLNAAGDIQDAKAEKAGTVSYKDKINEWFAQNGRNLPILGTAIRIGEAIGHIFSGDVLLGFKTMLGALGTNIGITQFVEWLSSKDDDEKSEMVKSGINFVTSVKDWISQNARNLPLLGFGIRISEAFQNLASGNIVEGLKGVAGALGSNFGLTQLVEWLSGEDEVMEEGDGEAQITQKKSIVKKLKEMIIGKFAKVWDSLPSWLKWTAARVLPDEVIDNIKDTKSTKSDEKRDVGSIKFKQKVTEDKVNEVYSDEAGFSNRDRKTIIKNNKDMIISPQTNVENVKEEIISPQSMREEVSEKPKPSVSTVPVQNNQVQTEQVETLKRIEEALKQNQSGNMNIANSNQTSQVNNYMTMGGSVGNMRDKYRRDW